jgi:hypothetical protein
MRQEEAACRRSHDIDERMRQDARDAVKRDADAKRVGVESDVSAEELMAACRLLYTAPPIEWAKPRLEEWQKLEIAREIALKGQGAHAQMNEWSQADKDRLAAIRARQAARTAKYERRQALKPSALWSRLKARAARVSWDSWG